MPSTARILVNCNRLGLSPKPGIVARYFALDKRLSLEPPHDSRGINLLHDPLWNKGTSFGISERERFGVRGLLPPRILDMDDQIARFLAYLDDEPDDIRKAVCLSELHDRNETLFHRVLVDNIEKLAPIVYTPTVGRVCLEFGSRFRRPRGTRAIRASGSGPRRHRHRRH